MCALKKPADTSEAYCTPCSIKWPKITFLKHDSLQKRNRAFSSFGTKKAGSYFFFVQSCLETVSFSHLIEGGNLSFEAKISYIQSITPSYPFQLVPSEHLNVMLPSVLREKESKMRNLGAKIVQSKYLVLQFWKTAFSFLYPLFTLVPACARHLSVLTNLIDQSIPPQNRLGTQKKKKSRASLSQRKKKQNENGYKILCQIFPVRAIPTLCNE